MKCSGVRLPSCIYIYVALWENVGTDQRATEQIHPL